MKPKFWSGQDTELGQNSCEKDMPSASNGHDKVSPEYQLTAKLIEAFRDTWLEKYQENLADPMTFSRLSILALSQLAAINGVDVGMTEEQFVNVCRANFIQAFKHAPRFS